MGHYVLRKCWSVYYISYFKGAINTSRKVRVWSDKITQEELVNRIMGEDYPRKYVCYEDSFKECRETIERLGVRTEDRQIVSAWLFRLRLGFKGTHKPRRN